MDAMGLLIIGAFILFFIVVLLLIKAFVTPDHREKASEKAKPSDHLEEIAHQLGWTYESSTMQIQGVHQGRQIVIDHYEPARSATGTLYALVLILGLARKDPIQVANPDQLMTGRVRVRVAVRNPSNGYMSLASKSRSSPVEQLLYGRTIIGIDEIDQEFAVESNPTELAVNVLERRDLQEKILAIAEVRPLSIVVRKLDLNFQVEELDMSDESILSIADIACDIADAIEEVG